MEGIYSMTFNKYFQYCWGWYIASYYNKAGRHKKILHVLASHHLNNSRDNPSATEKAEHKPSGQDKYFEGASLMGCWTAWCQGHPSGWHTTMWWEGLGAPSAPAQLEHSTRPWSTRLTHFSSLELLTRSALAVRELQDSQVPFISAKKPWLQWQLKVPSYWE